MNILLVNHYAGSVHHGMEYRPYYLAREWVRQGHRVHIVAASYSHLRRQAPGPSPGAQWSENIDGIDYLWLPTPPYQGNGAGRVRNMLAFVTRLWRMAPQLARTIAPDAVIASSTYPLDIWPAQRIARLAGARLLHEIHDLWPLSAIELGGYSARHPFIMLLQAAENHACRHADAVVSILPKVREHLQAHGMAPHKLHIIPNGADPDEWPAIAEAPGSPCAPSFGSAHSQLASELPSELATLLSKLRAAGNTVVGYAGSHGMANALDTLLDAARLLHDQPLAFVLVGAGPEKQRLQQKALRRGLAQVHFAEPVAKRQIPALLGSIDIAFLGWRRQPLYRFGIAPNKLLDYMMAGCPVLHAVDAGNDPVRDAGCGLSVAPDDPQALAEGLQQLHGLEPAARRTLGARGRHYALVHLTYPVLAQRFLNVIAQEVSHG